MLANQIMVISCCAVGCQNRQEPNSQISFYRFPADKERRQKWIAAMKRSNWIPTKYSGICSDHFINSEYLRKCYGLLVISNEYYRIKSSFLIMLKVSLSQIFSEWSTGIGIYYNLARGGHSAI